MAYYNNSVPNIPLTEQLSKGTRLVGRVNDSGNQPITTGWLELTADDLIVDGTINIQTLVIPKPRRFPLTGEPLNIELVNSQYSETTYRIRIGETVGLDDVVYAEFHAQIPYGRTINISDLKPTTIKREALPSTIYRVAEIIVSDPDLSARVMRIFNFRGNWAANTSYSPFDLVFVAGSPNRTFVCTTEHISPATFTTTNWQQII